MDAALRTGQHFALPHSTFPIPAPAFRVPRLRPAGPSPTRLLLGCEAWGAPTGVTAFSVPTVGASSRGKKCHSDRGVGKINDCRKLIRPEAWRCCRSAVSAPPLVVIDAPSTANLVFLRFSCSWTKFCRRRYLPGRSEVGPLCRERYLLRAMIAGEGAPCGHGAA